MGVTRGVATKPLAPASSRTTSPIVGVRPPTAAVMTVAHVAGAHTRPSPAVLGATVAHQDGEALALVAGKYPAANRNPLPIKEPRAQEVRFYGLLGVPAAVSQSGGSRGKREREHGEKWLTGKRKRRRSIPVALSGALINS